MPQHGSGRRPSATVHQEDQTLHEFELLREFLELRDIRTRNHRDRRDQDLEAYRAERVVIDRIERKLIDHGIAGEMGRQALQRAREREEALA